MRAAACCCVIILYVHARAGSPSAVAGPPSDPVAAAGPKGCVTLPGRRAARHCTRCRRVELVFDEEQRLVLNHRRT